MSNNISPLPWKTFVGVDIYDSKDDFIAQTLEAVNGDDAANAAFMVKAVNSHDKLIKGLREAKAQLMLNGDTEAAIQAIYAALASAEAP